MCVVCVWRWFICSCWSYITRISSSCCVSYLHWRWKCILTCDFIFLPVLLVMVVGLFPRGLGLEFQFLLLCHFSLTHSLLLFIHFSFPGWFAYVYILRPFYFSLVIWVLFLVIVSSLHCFPFFSLLSLCLCVWSFHILVDFGVLCFVFNCTSLVSPTSGVFSSPAVSHLHSPSTCVSVCI